MVVREDSLTLFGFADEDERQVFELLQTVTGVGPRLAQAMLAVHTPDALRRAVAAEDLAALTRVPGIGRKGAQRIVLELKDRLGPPARWRRGRARRRQPRAWATRCSRAWSAWAGPPREAERAVDAVADQAGSAPDVARSGARPCRRW